MENEGQNPTAQKDLYMLFQAAIPSALLIASPSSDLKAIRTPNSLIRRASESATREGNLGIPEVSGFETALRQG
jgi:hypothetical protein